jgi:Flp pilus assembly pilin Flp
VTTFAIALQAWLGQHLGRARDDRGAGLVEYSLLVAAIALVCFAAVQFFGGGVDTMLTESNGSIASSTG